MSISSLPSSINLIRYLLVWRVNHSLVRLPSWLPLELSFVLGNIIAERLPTNQARPWRKALEAWHEYDPFKLDSRRKQNQRLIIPDISWPIESTLFVYPTKRTFGQGELIMWELKLLGDNANHNLFLEVILPAIEQMSLTTNSRWKRSNKIWGRFDIDSIYVARGAQWEPLTVDGRLDLQSRVTPTQWSEGLIFDIPHACTFQRLNWITPFDLASIKMDEGDQKSDFPTRPSLSDVIVALISRLNSIVSNKPASYSSGWDLLGDEEKKSVQQALAQVTPIFSREQSLKRAPKNWPGRWMGSQGFKMIPEALHPYLNLASILHIGQYTHFGCGTFILS